jgi:hypothetical protein
VHWSATLPLSATVHQILTMSSPVKQNVSERGLSETFPSENRCQDRFWRAPNDVGAAAPTIHLTADQRLAATFLSIALSRTLLCNT